MYDDTPTAAELAEDEKELCPECNEPLKTFNGKSEYWGSVRTDKEIYCDNCTYGRIE